MLHALLHRKLDETTTDAQRLEDALTSTVFGLLVHAEAWGLLARWLGVAVEPRGVEPVIEGDCWFWPGLAYAEPDVLLKLDKMLVVVEAKYRSNRHDLEPDSEDSERVHDQLHRQYRCMTVPLSARPRYADAIEDAIRGCTLHQVFIVDARKHRRARCELEESASRLPAGARLRLVTWQTLFRLLVEPEFRGRRWAADLMRYLTVAGLDTFHGVTRSIDKIESIGQLVR